MLELQAYQVCIDSTVQIFSVTKSQFNVMNWMRHICQGYSPLSLMTPFPIMEKTNLKSEVPSRSLDDDMPNEC